MEEIMLSDIKVHILTDQTLTFGLFFIHLSILQIIEKLMYSE